MVMIPHPLWLSSLMNSNEFPELLPPLLMDGDGFSTPPSHHDDNQWMAIFYYQSFLSDPCAYWVAKSGRPSETFVKT